MDEPTKKQWGEGPWQHEPDHLEWVDEATGYKCKILRGPAGHLCGYVEVPVTHPAYGIHYNGITATEAKTKSDAFRAALKNRKGGDILSWTDDIPHFDTIPGIGEAILQITVHGGLTWADWEGEAWWFGFDCAHAGDLCPQMGALLHRIYIDNGETKKWEAHQRLKREGYQDTYRTIDYVRKECADLAQQLKALERGQYAQRTTSADRHE